MEKILLSSDSTCDLPKKVTDEYNIAICPISILLGDEEKYDTIDITAAGIIDFVNNTGILPKTSAITKETYYDFFKKFTDEGYQVIHFCISSKASSCYEHAEAAAKELSGVYVVDSYSLSAGQGLQILKAADMIKSGMSADDIFTAAKTLNEKVQTSFVVDRLDFLHKGGRCSSVALVASKFLKIHPSIAITDGALAVKKKYAGALKRALVQYVDDLADEFKNYDNTRAILIHSPADEDVVNLVRNEVKAKFAFNEIIDVSAGSTVTSHCGYNTVGVMFFLK